MRSSNQLVKILAVVLALDLVVPPLAARTRKGDRLLAQGRAAEARKEWDKALAFDEQALSEDPADPGYQLAIARVRFQASQFHVDQGLKIRAQGQLPEALAEFEKAYAINPATDIAEQEIRRTRAMIDREKKKTPQPGDKPEDKGLTPAQTEKKREQENFARMLPVPELKPLNPQPINLKMNNQTPKVLFETVGKVAGINVLFDPEYLNSPGRPQSIEFNNTTLDQALDYLSVATKSFWKPLSENTILVAAENPTKHRDFDEQVVKVFYLTNVTLPQEIQEIVTTLRTVAEIQKIFTYNAQNAIIVRAEADKMALAEKIVADLDKPRAEVVIDVLVMEVSRVRSRDLAFAVAPKGINSPVAFTPRPEISQVTTTTPSSTTNSTTTTPTPTSTTTTTTTSTTGAVPLTNLGRISTRDFSVTLPGGLIEALMTDSSTRILQSPQVRAADGAKASLRIGDKVPIATGSFQPGIGGVGVGISPLVNTQFTYQDVGVNVDISPKVHGTDEVSLHILVEISSVGSRVDIGGIQQPVISQRKVEHDIRIREGEVNVLGGLMQNQETKGVSGVPGLSSIPLIRRLFTSETLDRNQSELLIVLVPHIVRAPEVTDLNLRPIATGASTVVKLNYAPRKAAETPAAAPPSGPSGNVPTVSPQPGSPATAVPAAPPRTAPPTPDNPANAPPTAAVPPATTPAPATQPAETPARPPQVTFAPAQIAAQLSAAVTVSLLVENAADLGSAPMQIKFDPKILRLNDIVRGNVLSADGQQPIFSKNIMNDTGEATVNLSRLPGTAGANGSGTLITLVFQAVGRGDTTVTVPNLTLRDSKSQPLATISPRLVINVK